MPSIKSQILDAIVERLNDNPPAGIPTATRRRWLGGDDPLTAGISVMLAEWTTVNQGNRPVRVPTDEIVVQGRVAVEDPDAPEDAVADIEAWIIGQLDGQRLDGLAHELRELGGDYHIEPGDAVYVFVQVRFAAKYQTLRSDVSSAS